MIVSAIAILSWIVWIVCISYVGIIVFAAYFWYTHTKKKPVEALVGSPVSLLIPFRNEAENLPSLLDCLDSLKTQKSAIEIIFIDDHSEDQSAEILNARQKDNYRVGRAVGIGKKAAIAQGISMASYDTIFQLDADGTFNDQWFYSFQKKIDAGIDFITGIISIKSPKGWLDHFQMFELMALMGMTNAGIRSGYWYMANGANMAYRKNLYFSLSGSQLKFSSGDDMFLIEEAANQKLKIDFNNDKDGIVFTQPVKSITLLIHQRLRWASKNGALQSITLKGILMIVVFFNVLLIVLPILNSLYFYLWPIKIIIDFLYLKMISKDFDTEINWSYYLPCTIFYPFFIGGIGLLHLIGYKFSWKGR